MIDRRRRTTLAELWAGSTRSDRDPARPDVARPAAGPDGGPELRDGEPGTGLQGGPPSSPTTDRPKDSGGPSGSTQLVVLRGISGAGKSSIAAALQRENPSLAWVDQHHLRRTLPAGWTGRDTAETIDLIDATVRFCLGLGRTVLLEGTLPARQYRPMLRDLLADHAGRARLYYLDVSLQEAGRRIARRDQNKSAKRPVGHGLPGDLLAIAGELVIGEEPFPATVARIGADLLPAPSRCG